MATPSLQDGIDKAGSPLKLLWKPNSPPFKVPVVEPEYVGWREEQGAWRYGPCFSDLSHHMSDTFMEGPDCTRLLAAVSANDYERFEVGQAKQFVPVTAEGNIVTDGILLREAAQKYTLSGVPSAQNWVRYHAEKGGYDVTCTLDPDSNFRKGDPVLFRYQVQGPRALELVEKVFGGPLPKTRFFHSAEVSLEGRTFRALRHGMLGLAGYEFLGPWEHGAVVKDALLSAGKEFGLTRIGGLAYATNGIESGWIPTPTPGIYLAPELADYRRWLSLFSFEGQFPIQGTYLSENIADYFVSPFELGYGKSIAFNHEFIGRQALEQAKDKVKRSKVTLVFNPDDVRDFIGAEPDYTLSYARYRVEAGARLAGMSFYSAWFHHQGTILGLALVDSQFAAPGTEVTVLWGQHPGPGAAGEASGYKRLRATVQPTPYNEFARTQYRKD